LAPISICLRLTWSPDFPHLLLKKQAQSSSSTCAVLLYYFLVLFLSKTVGTTIIAINGENTTTQIKKFPIDLAE